MSTTTTLASAIATRFSELAQTLDYNDAPLQRLFPETQNPGGSTFTWPVHYGGNSSTVSFTENETFPAAGNELFATASVSYAGSHKVTRYNLSKISIDYLKGANNFDGIKEEQNGAMQAHIHACETGLVTDLEDAIAAASTYGGLDRATYKLASTLTNSSGLTLAELQTMSETLQKVEIGADWNSMVIMSTIDLINEYRDLQGVAYREMNYAIGSGNPFDLGKEQLVPVYGGRPWITVPTMTATVALMLDPKLVKRIRVRPITVEVLAATEDNIEIAITSAQRIVVTNPRKCGKIY